ncbi:MAG: YgiT-type zinc finger protein [bacterium]
MICEFCGGETVKKKVKKQHWFQGKLYLVENVEAEVCLECGERYFYAKVLDKLDRFLNTVHEIKDKMEVEVVSL